MSGAERIERFSGTYSRRSLDANYFLALADMRAETQWCYRFTTSNTLTRASATCFRWSSNDSGSCGSHYFWMVLVEGDGPQELGVAMYHGFQYRIFRLESLLL
jgi:hypothetical protein